MSRFLRTLLVLALGGLAACGGATPEPTPVAVADTSGGAVEPPPPAHQDPPASGPSRDVHLPPIVRSTTSQGLEVNVVQDGRLPIVNVRLTFRSGLSRDPEALPGLSRIVALMTKEGTRTRDSAELAEAIEFLGADLEVSTDFDSSTLSIRSTAEHLGAVLDLLADLALRPAFATAELNRLRQRERDRLTVQYDDPTQLARRAFFRMAYGTHPYAHVDATTDSLGHMRVADLRAWHAANYVPNNAFMVIVGSVDPEVASREVERAFRGWRSRPVAPVAFPTPPAPTGHQILLVHRPGSVQSLIVIGNLSIARNDAAYVPLDVANQVLGGSPASRLFMDLRERRSLTYGAYSSVDELVSVGPFRARAAVPNARTEPAMDAFMEHLERIVHEAPSDAEVADATRYLSDSFPLSIDTFGRLGWMVGYLRTFGLPDDYWDRYRSEIRAVTPARALDAAQHFIQPDRAIVVVVGDANVVAGPLARWGTVQIVDTNERPTTLEAIRASAGSAEQ